MGRSECCESSLVLLYFCVYTSGNRILRKIRLIGDGANDVGMIQEAYIGVGISGVEGMHVHNVFDGLLLPHVFIFMRAMSLFEN